MKEPRVAGIGEHALRHRLVGELHARPYMALHAPLQATHLLLLTGEDSAVIERERVADLCARAGAAVPSSEDKHFLADLGHYQLRWERHTEFSSFTFHAAGSFDEPFRRPVIERVPPDWLASLPGEVLMATHVAVEARDAPERSAEELGGLLAPDSTSGVLTGGGKAVVWTDHRVHGDGFSRILVRDVALSPAACGRLVQRLIEAFDYRMMALLGLPMVEAITPRIATAERALEAITTRLAEGSGVADEREMLAEVSRIAAEVEAMNAQSGYRFAATRAYYGLVERRIGNLREKRIDGLQTLSDFFARRLEPAIATCEAADRRQRALAARVSRASGLLRTRVDVALEEQNRDLLASMNRRARLQLRLQQAVEGLSVVVLSYYLVGLVRYLLKALHEGGIAVNVDLVTGAAVPVVIAAVFLAMHRLRARTGGD